MKQKLIFWIVSVALVVFVGFSMGRFIGRVTQTTSSPMSGSATTSGDNSPANTGSGNTFSGSPACDTKVLYYVALHKLHPLLGEFPTGNYDDHNLTQKEINRQQEKIVCLRTWVKTKVTDSCLADQYIYWLDYFSTSSKEAQEWLNTPPAERKDSSTSYESEQKALDAKVSRYNREHPSPDPDPQCHNSGQMP